MKRTTILLFTLIFCAITTLTFAQTEQKKLALVIGNANYQHGGKLKNPVNDANLMATTLQELGFTVIKKTDANLKTMQQAAIDFTNKIKDYDVALFYYAGHGVQVNGINYLVPIDAKMDNELSTKYQAFDISDINYAFAQNSGNMNIMILDACRDNPFRSWQRGGERGFKALSNQATGTIIAFATREGETASDGTGNNGLFTEKLVQQMNITQDINSVFKNTRVAVLQASENKQCPQEWDMSVGSFYFTKKGTNNNNNNTDPQETTWGDEEVVYKYGNLNIYTTIAGYFFLDDKKKGYLNANTRKPLNNVTTGKHFYKLETDNEKITGNITVYENKTAYIEIKTTKQETKDLPNQFTDNRDGKVYKIVEIGNQVWMAENLAYKPSSGNSWAYDNDQNNVAKYGYLYDWETAKDVCPDGYHLPTDDEWKELETELGMTQVEVDKKFAWRGTNQGDQLKAKTGWDSNGNGTNESGFSALPGGYRSIGNVVHSDGPVGNWWNASPSGSSYAWARVLDYSKATIYNTVNDRAFGFSVRCLMD